MRISPKGAKIKKIFHINHALCGSCLRVRLKGGKISRLFFSLSLHASLYVPLTDHCSTGKVDVHVHSYHLAIIRQSIYTQAGKQVILALQLSEPERFAIRRIGILAVFFTAVVFTAVVWQTGWIAIGSGAVRRHPDRRNNPEKEKTESKHRDQG